jgi:hypothetical protein
MYVLKRPSNHTLLQGERCRQRQPPALTRITLCHPVEQSNITKQATPVEPLLQAHVC